MTLKSKGAPVSRHPNADRVIPNPWFLYGAFPTELQTLS